MIKRERKLNKILVIAAAILLAVFSVFAVLAPQIDDWSGISASAEEGAEETSEETPEEETIYPTDNLFDISNVIQGDNLQSNDKDINCSGYGQSIGLLRNLCSTLKVGAIVTLSLIVKSTTGVPPTFVQIQGQILYVATGNVTFTVTEDGLNSDFYLYNTTFENKDVPTTTVFSDIMLNLGEVAYPYRPCNKSYYDNGYTAGESAGYTQGKEDGKAEGKAEGYTEGYNAASDDLNLGVLKDATVSASLLYFNYAGNGSYKTEVSFCTLEFLYNSLNLQPFLNEYLYYDDGDDNTKYILNMCTFTINFAVPFLYSQFPILVTANTTGNGTYLGIDDVTYYSVRDTSVTASSYVIEEGSYPADLKIKSMTFIVNNVNTTDRICTLGCSSGQYQNGYTAGFNAGNTSGYDNGYSNGYSEGYSSGKDFQAPISYDKGYQAGLSIAGNGSLRSLIFAVVDSPIQSFTSLLDFEILGVNMKNFAISILSFAFLIAVVRFISGKS